MQAKEIFNTAIHRLKRAEIPDPELEAALLLSHVLKMERTDLLLAGQKVIDDDQFLLFEKYLARRLDREPLAYITGIKEFWSLPFKVTKDVLIPRPETEFLLEKALKKTKILLNDALQEIKILDLGTGSGVIAVIMALELEAAKITAVDYSHKALQVALNNAHKHKVADRINFVNCDWFEGLSAKAEFDIVVSNPPYIASSILAAPHDLVSGSLQPEVVGFEPRLALDGGDRGVKEIEKIAVGLGKVIMPGGWIFMEIGADQEKEVLGIFQKTAVYGSMKVFNDYAGLPRVLEARKN